MSRSFLATIIGILKPQHRQYQVFFILYRKLAVIINDKVGNERPIIPVDCPLLIIQSGIGQHFFGLFEEKFVRYVAVAVRYHVDNFAIRNYGIFKSPSGFHLGQDFQGFHF
nr:hypothetical protein [uncultured bacterium]